MIVEILKTLQEMSLLFIFLLLLSIIILIIAIKAVSDYRELRQYLNNRNDTFKKQFNITEDLL